MRILYRDFSLQERQRHLEIGLWLYPQQPLPSACVCVRARICLCIPSNVSLEQRENVYKRRISLILLSVGVNLSIVTGRQKCRSYWIPGGHVSTLRGHTQECKVRISSPCDRRGTNRSFFFISFVAVVDALLVYFVLLACLFVSPRKRKFNQSTNSSLQSVIYLVETIRISIVWNISVNKAFSSFHFL